MLKTRWRASVGHRGFSLVELMVTISLLGLLLGLAAPAFSTWTRNAQVRSVSDALQSGLRFAQSEAVRRNRQVVFFRTSSKLCDDSIVSNATGIYWAMRTVPLVAGDAVETLQCGALTEATGNVSITGPRLLCFNSAGRLTANANPGVGNQPCAVPTGGVGTYVVSNTGADRSLNVTVALGGQVRMCLVGGAGPDGC